MKILKVLFLLFAVPLAYGAEPVRLEFFWHPLDGQGWQRYFVLDALDRRLPDLDLEVRPLVAKDGQGNFTSERGEAEVEEALRVSWIRASRPKDLFNYLNARGLAPWESGWIEAARFAAIDLDELSSGASSAEGRSALESDWQKARALMVDGPSLFINGERYQGGWKIGELLDLVNSKLPDGKRLALPSAEKSQIAKDSPRLWVVVESGVAGSEDEGLTRGLLRYFPLTSPQVTASDSPEGQKFIKELGLDFLPAYVLEDKPLVRKSLKSAIDGGWLKLKGEAPGSYFVVPSEGRSGVWIQRPSQSKELGLFVMSQCPFGVQAESAVLQARKSGNFPKDVQLKLHYIADVVKGGADRPEELDFRSLHGPEEWKENVRQLLIQKYHPDKLWAYLEKRNEQYRPFFERGTRIPDLPWEPAAKAAGIDPKDIQKRFSEGKALLVQDIQRGKEIQVQSSPTFLWENRVMTVGLGGLGSLPGFEKVAAASEGGAGGAACASN